MTTSPLRSGGELTPTLYLAAAKYKLDDKENTPRFYPLKNG